MEIYGKEYFNGTAITKNYQAYKNRKYETLAKELHKVLNLNNKFVLDFGCGLGLLVRELYKLNCNILGTDVSAWAINYGKNNFKKIKNYLVHYTKELLALHNLDYIFFMDVLEHCESGELKDIMELLASHDNINILVRIPVANKKNGNYVLDVSRNDKTHIQCLTKNQWTKIFKKYGFEVDKVLNGKQAYDSKGVMVCTFKKVK